MKLADLKFDNPNNSCLSLRILAELVRTGEAQVSAQEQHTDGLQLNVWDKNTRANLKREG